MEIKIKEPELRFQGFTEEWNETTLGEIADIIGGGTPDTKKPEYWDGEIDWYSPTEIGQATYATGSRRKITSLGLAKSTAKILPADKTILFTSRAGIGDMAILKKDGATNQGFQSMVVKENNDVYFVYSIGDKIKKFALQNASGSTFLEVSGKTLRKMTLLVPLKIEQSKIGSFFKQLDDTISRHQQELYTLKQTKQGFLQKMFPKEGEKFPEVRFKGYEEKWEAHTLNNIFNIIDGDRGKNYPGINDFKDIGDTVFLDTGNVKKTGFDFSEKKFISKEKDDLLRNGKLILNDFVLTSRGTLGNIAYYDKLFSELYPSVRINSAMLILRPILSDRISNDYMTTVLRGSIIKTFMSTNHVGSAQPHITKGEFSKLKIGIPPTLEEQIKIGEFFKQLDKTIELQEKELEALKQTKKAFLQKMFV